MRACNHDLRGRAPEKIFPVKRILNTIKDNVRMNEFYPPGWNFGSFNKNNRLIGEINMFRKITRPILFVGALGIFITGITFFSNGADAWTCKCTCEKKTSSGKIITHYAGKMNSDLCPSTCQKLGYAYSTCGKPK